MFDLRKMIDFDILQGKQIVDFVLIAGILIGAVVIGKIVKYLLFQASKRANQNRSRLIELILLSFARSVLLILIAIGIKASIYCLSISPNMLNNFIIASNVFFIISIGHLFYWLAEIPSFWLRNFAQKTETKLDDMLVPIVRKTIRILVVCLAIVQIAQVLSDKPVTSILAGLGIGGLAVALAAQDTIKNFFGSIVLFVDRPFELGDLMKVDGQTGAIEEVGFRSTRFRTLDGHLITIPNGELANKTLENISKRPNIKKVINLGLTYDTPPEKIDEAIYVLKDLLKEHEGIDQESPARIFFDEFGSFYLNIKIFLWYHPADYWKFMDFLSELNLKILSEFNSRGIEFAFPTQTLFMAGDSNRPINNIEISSLNK